MATPPQCAQRAGRTANADQVDFFSASSSAPQVVSSVIVEPVVVLVEPAPIDPPVVMVIETAVLAGRVSACTAPRSRNGSGMQAGPAPATW